MLGNLWAIVEDYSLSILNYNRAIELGIDDTSVYNNRGISLVDVGEYDMAIADFEHALELDPENTIACSNLEIARRLKANREKSVGSR